MASYYDDNFGWYDIDCDEDIDFYREVQELSEEKECYGCGRIVSLLPQYGYCDSCATKREQGWDI